jgi:hypothetical protein
MGHAHVASCIAVDIAHRHSQSKQGKARHVKFRLQPLLIFFFAHQRFTVTACVLVSNGPESSPF